MEPKRAPVPFSATYTPRNELPSISTSSPDVSSQEDDYTYNEKDAYLQQQESRVARGSKSSSRRPHDSVISHPFSPKASYPPSPCSSISSEDRRQHADIQTSQTAIEARNLRIPPQAHLDPEKHGYGSSHGHKSSHRHSGSVRGPNAVVYDQSEYQEKAPEEKAWQLLFFLSGPCAFLSIMIALWTAVALLISLVLAPLKFCTTRPNLSDQIRTFLAPALNLQLHLVYSHNASTEYSAPMLVVIHLFAPLIAFGVAIAAWTAAAFWFFSSILGDPGGHDGHNDGKESILGVRNWWERWLSRALR